METEIRNIEMKLEAWHRSATVGMSSCSAARCLLAISLLAVPILLLYIWRTHLLSDVYIYCMLLL